MTFRSPDLVPVRESRSLRVADMGDQAINQPWRILLHEGKSRRLPGCRRHGPDVFETDFRDPFEGFSNL